MFRKPLLFVVVSCILMVTACSEEGPGGTSTILGSTAHHDLPIPDAKVYIRYGSLESPGSDPAFYDDSTSSDALAKFSFSGLNKGKYYLYGVGFDSTSGEVVRAGLPVDLKSGQTIEVLVPVTE